MRHELAWPGNQSVLTRVVGRLVLAVMVFLGLASGAEADILFTAIGAGEIHTCGVKANAAVACWGADGFGQANPLCSSSRDRTRK